jgi:hypothetical protein
LLVACFSQLVLMAHCFSTEAIFDSFDLETFGLLSQDDSDNSDGSRGIKEQTAAKFSAELFSSCEVENDIASAGSGVTALDTMLEDLYAVNEDFSFDTDIPQDDILEIKTEVGNASETSGCSGIVFNRILALLHSLFVQQDSLCCS